MRCGAPPECAFPGRVPRRIGAFCRRAGSAARSGAKLKDLELAYAPPFGSAKDPVNMLGYVDDNIVSGTTDTIQWHEVAAAVDGGAILLDVRSPGEVAQGAIPGAIHIPVDELRSRIEEAPDGEIVTYCAVGIRGHVAARLLTQAGRRVRNLDGGYRTWSAGTAARSVGEELLQPVQ